MDEICDICNKEVDELFTCVRCDRQVCERCIDANELCKYCQDDINNPEGFDEADYLVDLGKVVISECDYCGFVSDWPLIECKECRSMVCRECVKKGLCLSCYRKLYGSKK